MSLLLTWHRLFKPVHIPSLGSFQDGGLRHNNPIKIALNEMKQICPRSTDPDFVLSLGTGAAAEKPIKLIPSCHWLVDGFLSRLGRSLVYSLNGEHPWRDLMNVLDEAKKASFVRLNIPFRLGEKIRLDDTSKIEYLMTSVKQQKDLVQKQSVIVLFLMASAFYFELASMPQFHNGCFEVSGFLQCRSDAKKILEVLTKHFKTVSVVTDMASFGVLDQAAICGVCSRLRMPLVFRVPSLSDIVKVSLVTEVGQTRQISGSPNSMSWYVQQQGLDSSFGHQDHSITGERLCRHCGVQSHHDAVIDVPLKKRKQGSHTFARKRARHS